MDQDFADRPNKVPWPPIVFLVVALAALALEAIWPMGPISATKLLGLRIGGAVIAAAGLGLDLAAMLAMHRARTNILPHRAADRLVTDGVFAISRNPIYLGNTLLLIGVALALPSSWMAAGALLAAMLVDRLAIRREERHLAARFEQAYAAYAARVPRWIGLRR